MTWVLQINGNLGSFITKLVTFLVLIVFFSVLFGTSILNLPEAPSKSFMSDPVGGMGYVYNVITTMFSQLPYVQELPWLMVVYIPIPIFITWIIFRALWPGGE